MSFFGAIGGFFKSLGSQLKSNLTNTWDRGKGNIADIVSGDPSRMFGTNDSGRADYLGAAGRFMSAFASRDPGGTAAQFIRDEANRKYDYSRMLLEAGLKTQDREDRQAHEVGQEESRQTFEAGLEQSKQNAAESLAITNAELTEERLREQDARQHQNRLDELNAGHQNRLEENKQQNDFLGSQYDLNRQNAMGIAKITSSASANLFGLQTAESHRMGATFLKAKLGDVTPEEAKAIEGLYAGKELPNSIPLDRRGKIYGSFVEANTPRRNKEETLTEKIIQEAVGNSSFWGNSVTGRPHDPETMKQNLENLATAVTNLAQNTIAGQEALPSSHLG